MTLQTKRFLVAEDIDAQEVFARAEAAGHAMCVDIPRGRERAHEVGFWIAPSGAEPFGGVARGVETSKRVFWVEAHAFDARLVVVVAGAYGDMSVPAPFDALRLLDAEEAASIAERAEGAERPRALLRAIVVAEGQVSSRLRALLDAALEAGISMRRAALFGATFFRHESLERWISDVMARYPKGDERHDVFAAIRALEAQKKAGEHTWDLLDTDDVRLLTEKLSEAHASGQHLRVIAAADRILAQRYHETNAFALACRALARAARGELWHARVDAYAAEAVGAHADALPDAVRAALSALSARDVRELDADPPADAFAIVAAIAGNSSADAPAFFERLRALPRLGDARELEFHTRHVVAALACGARGGYEAAKRLVARKPKSRIAAGLFAKAAPDGEREAALVRYAELLDAAHEEAEFDEAAAELAERALVTVREEDLLRDLLRSRQRAGAPRDELLARAERNVAVLPESALAWQDLGMMRTGLLLHAEAAAAYSKAIELYQSDELSGHVYFGESNAVAWFNRACERTKCGDGEGALDDLAEACRRDGKYIEMAKTEEYFDPLRSDARFQSICKGDLPDAPKTRAPFAETLEQAKAATFRGGYEEALDLAEAALAVASTDAQRVDALATVCFAATWASDLDRAIEAGGEAAALAEALASSGAADADRDFAEPHHMLAGALHAAGEHDEAEASYQKALAIRTSKHGPAHPVLAKTYGDLARLSSDRGRRDEAVARAEKGVQILRDAAFGAAPIEVELREEALADLVILANNVLFLRRTGGEFEAALASAELAVAAYEAFSGSVFNTNILQSIANELGAIADFEPAFVPQVTALLARLEQRFARTQPAEPPEVKKARATWDRIVADLARVHDEVSSEPGFLADMLASALRGEPPRPEVARVPGAATALVQFGRLVATPGTTLIVLAPMTIDLLRSGAKSFFEVLEDLSAIHIGYVASPRE